MASKPTLSIGEWEIDRIDGQISRAGEELRLRPKIMEVLLCLAACPDELVERDEIIAPVRGRDTAALDLLEQSIASGWQTYWWFHMQRDPALAALPKDVRFAMLVEKITDRG